MTFSREPQSVEPGESPRQSDLRQSELRFRLALTGDAITVFEQDRDLRYTWVFPQQPHFPNDNIGKTDAELVPGPEGAALMDLKRQVLATGRPRRAEMRVTLPGGMHVYDIHVEPRFDEARNVVGVGGAAFDISERRRTEDALRESQERFRQLADNLPHGFIYQILQHPSGDLQFSYVSGGVENLLGISPDEAIANPTLMHSMILEEDFPRVRAREEQCYRQRIPFDCQFRVRAPSGAVRWLHCRSMPRPGDALQVLWDGIAIDITERKVYEHALAQSEQRFSRFMQHLPGLAWIKDLAGRYVYANDAAIAAFSVPRERLIGKRDTEVFPADTARQFMANDQTALASAGGIQVVETLTQPDGRLHHSLVSKFAIPGTEGRPALVGGMAIDITDRLQAETSLKEADRLKDEFLAMLAHELRNPLAPIRNALHIIKFADRDDEAFHHARDMAERQVRHMARLIDDLLDVSRISRGRIELRMETLDLGPVLRRTVDALMPAILEKRHELHMTLPEQPLHAFADATRIEQVLTNLLNNAIKYTEPGGRIDLTLVRGALAPGGEAAAEIHVRDSGVGIGGELLPRVFELFVQAERRLDRAHGGLGIGLTLVKRLVEMHGGQVEAFSRGLGQGAEFVVRLPLEG